MSNQEKLHPAVFHALVTLGLCLLLYPQLPIVYLLCLSVYYTGKGILLWRRKRWPGLALLCRLAGAAVLAVFPTEIMVVAVYGANPIAARSDAETAFRSFWFVVFAAFWLFVFSIPRRLRSRRDAKRLALERQERDRRDAETRRLSAQAADQKTQELRRRKEARARCELLFSLYKPDINARFDRAMLDSFLKEYMHDGEPVDAVERRADELCAIMEKHRETVNGKARPTTIEQLATWFLEEKKRVESLAIDDEFKDEHLAHLNIRYSELSQEILEKIKP